MSGGRAGLSGSWRAREAPSPQHVPSLAHAHARQASMGSGLRTADKAWTEPSL